jgi:hypothetical protein
MTKNKYILDYFEMYSFTTYLYFYGFFYSYIFEQKKIIIFLSIIFSNIVFYYIFNYNFISLICHLYWKNNLNTIAIPQLLSCVSNIMISKNTFINRQTYFINTLINILLFHFIGILYKNELIESRNLRFIISILYFFIRFFF